MKINPFVIATLLASTAMAVPALAQDGEWQAPSILPSSATPSIVSESGGEITVLIASGGRSGLYYPGAEVVDAYMPAGFDADAAVTAGSWANVKMAIEGEAHAIVAQPDAIEYLETAYPQYAGMFAQIGDLHWEYALVLCNRDVDWSSVASNLEDDDVRLAIVGRDSGTNLMFGNWIAEDRGYRNTHIVYFDDWTPALTSVSSGQNHCLAMASGLSSPRLEDIDDDYYRSLRLVETNDKDFNDSTNRDGDRLYEFTDLPKEAFRGINAWDIGDNPWSIEVTTWQAGLYAFQPSFTGADGSAAFEALAESMQRAGPAAIAAEEAAAERYGN